MHKKECARCHDCKPLEDFYKESSRGDGRRPYCKACCKKDNKRKYLANREVRLAHSREYVRNNRARVNARMAEWKKNLRLAVLHHYSRGSMSCALCGERCTDFLVIDHIAGGGNEHRKNIRGVSIYVWLHRNNYPDGFRVLCFNCNYGVYRGGHATSSRGGILSGPEILRYIEEGHIKIDPFEKSHLNPVSVDLTLGPEVKQYLTEDILDVRVPPRVTSSTIGSEGLVLRPHEGYLLHTQETIWSDCTVPVLDGKSSLGRLFISVHETAGYIDPGFLGQVTLEVTVSHPVRVYSGMRFCQIRFHPIVGRVELYKGHYAGSTARGAVPSLAHQQMAEITRQPTEASPLGRRTP